MSLMFKRQSHYLDALLTENSVLNTDSPGPQKTNNSALVNTTTRELLGIRRMARVCSKSLWQWGDYYSLRTLFRTSHPRAEEAKPTCFDVLDENCTQNCVTSIRVPKGVNKFSKLDKRADYNVVRKLEKTLRVPLLQRILVISNVPANIGVNCIMSQIYGGPLERLVYHSNWKSPWMEVSFINASDANDFYNFAIKRPLSVNGQCMKVDWANTTNTDSTGDFHPPVSKHLLHEINTYGSRRCLVFAKHVPGKATSSRRLHYPDPITHLSKDLDIRIIKSSFAQFGEIVSINPVISKLLSFSVTFADIKSAIIVKRACEMNGSKMNKLFGNWTVQYGKDCADRPCIAI